LIADAWPWLTAALLVLIGLAYLTSKEDAQ
jgi:hypothetical protein